MNDLSNVRADNAALLIYDMQVGIRSQIHDGGRITEQCRKAIDAARAAGMRIAFTRHVSCPLPWMGRSQRRTAMAWQRATDEADLKPWFLRGSAQAEIVPELAPRDDDMIFEKLSMSAFEGTALSFVLRDCGIDAVAIAGIALEIGIEPTVRHATDLGFTPIVLADACGSGNANAGARALETMKFIGEAILSDVRSFAAAMER